MKYNRYDVSKKNVDQASLSAVTFEHNIILLVYILYLMGTYSTRSAEKVLLEPFRCLLSHYKSFFSIFDLLPKTSCNNTTGYKHVIIIYYTRSFRFSVFFSIAIIIHECFVNALNIFISIDE